MNNLLNELLTRIKTNCEGSNHDLTKDQLDDIRDVLSHFANRFDAMETLCEMVYKKYDESELTTEICTQLDLVFPES